MSGLLYKDYLAVKGKKYIYGLLGATGVFLILRLLALNNADFAIILGGVCMTLLPTLIIVLPNTIENNIFAVDEGKGGREYVLSLPITKKQYVASKYVFLGIIYYVLLSISELWGTIYCIKEELEDLSQMVMSTMSLLPLLVCICLLTNAIELPFLFIWGRKKGQRIRLIGLVLLFFGVIIYLFFGNLTWLEKFNLGIALNYFMEHPDLSIPMLAIFPILTLGVYYLSYRISNHYFERKEWEYDE